MRQEEIATQNSFMDKTLKRAISEENEEKLIKCFLDIIALKAVKEAATSGYDILAFIHKKFHLLLSAGSVYSVLYSLERKGLITASFDRRARCYALTEKGKETLNAVAAMQDRMKALVATIF